MECPTCDGRGGPECTNCHGSALITVSRCPQKLIGEDIRMLLRGADLADKGSWPVTGGWLDQSASFVDGVQFVRAEEAAQSRSRKS